MKPGAERRNRVRALALVVLLLAGTVPAAAQRPASTDPAVRALVEQGNSWLGRGRGDLARQAFERALLSEPRNAAALAGLAQAHAMGGNRGEAEAALVKLRGILGEDSAEYRAVERAVRGFGLDAAQLGEARRLAREGRNAEAAALYRRLFGGVEPPPQYAVEYFLTLAGTQDGFEEAVRGLRAAAERRSDDLRVALALAQVLTYRAETRPEGMAALERLAQQPAVAGDATAALRRALVWDGPRPENIPLMERFLRRVRNDPEVTRLLQTAREAPPPPGPEVLARIGGFEALEAGRLNEAEARFQSALRVAPNDADALGGLGIIRLRQGRFAEARDLLERAMAADPTKAEQWRGARNGAVYALALAEGRELLRRRRPDEAERRAREALALQTPDPSAAYVLLGDVLSARQLWADAETAYRGALEIAPRDQAALAGLVRALEAQGKRDQAREFARRLPRSPPDPQTVAIEQARRAAAQVDDPDQAVAILRRQLLSGPNPWVALDLAVRLQSLGRTAEARETMAPYAARPATDVDSAFAAALFAERDGRLEDAAALIEKIPAARRPPAMTELYRRVTAVRDVGRLSSALRGQDAGAARDELLRRAARTTADGLEAAIVVRAFAQAGDRRNAAEAGRLALLQPLTEDGKLVLATALAEAGAMDLAGRLARELVSSRTAAPSVRLGASRILAGAAVAEAYAENARGDQAAAFERLRPVLETEPDNADAQRALAQLYLSASRPREAQTIAERLLQADRGDREARRLAIDAALALGDPRRAEALLVEGRTLHPGDDALDLLEARTALARQDPNRAEAALARVIERRRAAQASAPVVVASASGSLPNPFRETAARQAPGVAEGPMDPEIAELQRRIVELRKARAPDVRVGAGLAARSGSSGLDRLTAVQGRAEASVPTGVGSAALTARVETVLADAGRLPGNLVERRRFGYNAINDPGIALPGSVAGSGRDFGIAPAIGIRSDVFRVEIGTTPLGFRRTNAIGAAAVSVPVTPGFRVTASVDRAAVADTLLSWGGVRDPTTGRVWGGVVRTGGRLTLDFPGRDWSGYVFGGGGMVQGRETVSNRFFEAGAGLSRVVWRRGDEQNVAVGVEGTYLDYRRNSRHFTFGHGGYFSPQNFFGVALPVDWRGRGETLSWRLGASIGLAAWRERSEPFYPTDSGAQAALEDLAALIPDLETRHRGDRIVGLTGGLRGEVEWQLGDGWSVGGLAAGDASPKFQSGRLFLFTRLRFE